VTDRGRSPGLDAGADIGAGTARFFRAAMSYDRHVPEVADSQPSVAWRILKGMQAVLVRGTSRTEPARDRRVNSRKYRHGIRGEGRPLRSFR